MHTFLNFKLQKERLKRKGKLNQAGHKADPPTAYRCVRARRTITGTDEGMTMRKTDVESNKKKRFALDRYQQKGMGDVYLELSQITTKTSKAH